MNTYSLRYIGFTDNLKKKKLDWENSSGVVIASLQSLCTFLFDDIHLKNIDFLTIFLLSFCTCLFMCQFINHLTFFKTLYEKNQLQFMCGSFTRSKLHFKTESQEYLIRAATDEYFHTQLTVQSLQRRKIVKNIHHSFQGDNFKCPFFFMSDRSKTKIYYVYYIRQRKAKHFSNN